MRKIKKKNNQVTLNCPKAEAFGIVEGLEMNRSLEWDFDNYTARFEECDFQALQAKGDKADVVFTFTKYSEDWGKR
jgi:hypothetical protein